jgi:tetratricopeptide (TPR) repeat protein
MVNRRSVMFRAHSRAPLQIILVASLASLSWAASMPTKSVAEDPQYQYLRGLVEERAGNTVKALEAYERVVTQDPQALEAFRDIGALQLRLGHTDEALKAAERVRDLAPKDPASFIFLGNVRVAQGDLAKAAEAYESARKLDPKNVNALENLGNYYAIVDPEKAVSFYEQVLMINPNGGETMLQLGLVEQKLGHSDKAIEYYDKALGVDPHQSAPYLAKAEIYEQRRSTAAAIAAYQQALLLQPKNPQILMRLGHMDYQSGSMEDAEKQFLAARELAPQDPSIYYWLARVAEERKDWAKATDYAQQAFQYSQDPQFLPLAAYYMTLDHNLIKAITWLERARKVDPTNANTLLFLGMNNLELGRTKEAHEALLQGVKLYPKDPQMSFQLGVSEDRLGNAAAADAAFQNVLTIDPKNAGAMNYLGYSWTEQGVHLEEAEKMLREAVRLEPDNAAFLDSLGWLQFKKNHMDEARELLEKASGLDEDALILGHLADVHAAQNHQEIAMRILAQAATVDPENETVHQRLNQLAAQVLPALEPRKLLKYAEGNFRQMSHLSSDVALELRWIGKAVPGKGRFYYMRADQAALDLQSLGKEGPVRFRLQGTTLRVEPAAQAARFGGMSAENLKDILNYFSGAIPAMFDDPAVQVDRSGSVFHFKRGKGELWMDGRRGTITRLRAPAKDGFNEIEVTKDAFVEGLWLPEQLKLRNTSSGWNALLTFSGWAINNGTTIPGASPAP